ncbi:MAG: hypothetical protein LQ342_007070 [Letrouitia transgressa]|nr:MAG: hypothetical protein LQ342_007070 [Letrouitia transgressa]
MPSPELTRFARAVSRTLSWSLSFYPQPLLNLRRRSTTGTTPAFPFLNVLGFAAYLLSTTCFYASPLIRAQYAARNPRSPEPTVRGNDVAFAAHAAVLSTVVWSMFWPALWGFEQEPRRQGTTCGIGRGVWGIWGGCLAGVGVTAVVVGVNGGGGGGGGGGDDGKGWAWIDVVYAVGYVKLLVTVIKYIPQAWTNHRRKSTVGWSIDQILMDLLGGVLSIAQLLIDSSLQDDWSGVTGNPVKLGLGNVSILFDVIFMLQHYVFYRGANKVKEEQYDDERQFLLSRDEDEEVIRHG